RARQHECCEARSRREQFGFDQHQPGRGPGGCASPANVAAAAGETLRTCRSCCGNGISMPAAISASCTRTVRLLRIFTQSPKLLVQDRIEKSSEFAPKPTNSTVGAGSVAMPS